jgi:hypothetical protein
MGSVRGLPTMAHCLFLANEILLECGHVHFFTSCLWLFS